MSEVLRCHGDFNFLFCLSLTPEKSNSPPMAIEGKCYRNGKGLKEFSDSVGLISSGKLFLSIGTLSEGPVKAAREKEICRTALCNRFSGPKTQITQQQCHTESACVVLLRLKRASVRTVRGDMYGHVLEYWCTVCTETHMGLCRHTV